MTKYIVHVERTEQYSVLVEADSVERAKSLAVAGKNNLHVIRETQEILDITVKYVGVDHG